MYAQTYTSMVPVKVHGPVSGDVVHVTFIYTELVKHNNNFNSILMCGTHYLKAQRSYSRGSPFKRENYPARVKFSQSHGGSLSRCICCLASDCRVSFCAAIIIISVCVGRSQEKIECD